MRGRRTLVVLLASLTALVGAVGPGTAADDMAEPQPSKLLFRSSIYGKVGKLRLATTDGAKQNIYQVEGQESVSSGSWKDDGTRFIFSVERRTPEGDWGGVDLIKGEPGGHLKRIRHFQRALRGPQWSAKDQIFVWDTFEDFALLKPSGETIANGYWNYSGGDFPRGWSPNGRRFLIENDYCHQWDQECFGPWLKIRRFDSGVVGSLRVHGSHGSWSPDGGSIALVDEGMLYVFSLDTSERTLVPTTTAVAETTPTWSPAGDRIAYLSGGDIYTVDVDGSNESQLTSSYGADMDPRWSPDGADIAFVRDNDGHSRTDIYVMAADGTNVRRLTYSKLYESVPTWQPLPD